MNEPKILSATEGIGKYQKDEACCVGARLAAFFDVAHGLTSDYREGVDAFAIELGGNVAHVIVMLQEAGAGHDPLSGAPWKITRQAAWNRLLAVEELPSLRGADLSYLALIDYNVQGSDFTGADLSRSDLDKTCFEDCDLTRANLRLASLEHTNFQRATLAKADLSCLTSRRTYFDHANLQEAYFSDTEIRDGSFTHADLRKADLKNAVLRGFFEGANLLGCRVSGKSLPDDVARRWKREEGAVRNEYIIIGEE